MELSNLYFSYNAKISDVTKNLSDVNIPTGTESDFEKTKDRILKNTLLDAVIKFLNNKSNDNAVDLLSSLCYAGFSWDIEDKRTILIQYLLSRTKERYVVQCIKKLKEMDLQLSNYVSAFECGGKESKSVIDEEKDYISKMKKIVKSCFNEVSYRNDGILEGVHNLASSTDDISKIYPLIAFIILTKYKTLVTSCSLHEINHSKVFEGNKRGKISNNAGTIRRCERDVKLFFELLNMSKEVCDYELCVYGFGKYTNNIQYLVNNLIISRYFSTKVVNVDNDPNKLFGSYEYLVYQLLHPYYDMRFYNSLLDIQMYRSLEHRDYVSLTTSSEKLDLHEKVLDYLNLHKLNNSDEYEPNYTRARSNFNVKLGIIEYKKNNLNYYNKRFLQCKSGIVLCEGLVDALSHMDISFDNGMLYECCVSLLWNSPI